MTVCLDSDAPGEIRHPPAPDGNRCLTHKEYLRLHKEARRQWAIRRDAAAAVPRAFTGYKRYPTYSQRKRPRPFEEQFERVPLSVIRDLQVTMAALLLRLVKAAELAEKHEQIVIYQLKQQRPALGKVRTSAQELSKTVTHTTRRTADVLQQTLGVEEQVLTKGRARATRKT